MVSKNTVFLYFKKRDDYNKYKTKTNPKMCILIYFKIQTDQPKITRNAFKKLNFQFVY